MDHKKQAAAIQNRLRQAAEQINSSQDLSDIGRKRQLAATFAAAKLDMGKVTADLATTRRTRLEQLQRQLFGAVRTDPATLINDRDARDRADRVKNPDDARGLLQLASLANDDSLGRAVALAALNRARSGGVDAYAKWGSVLDDWAAGDPHRDALLTELGDLERAPREDGMFTYTVTRPTGLTPGDNAAQLAYEADRPDTEPTAGTSRVLDATHPGLIIR